MKEKELYRNYIVVKRSALINNYKQFRNLIDKECKLMAVVKSNAYGHDFVQYSREMEILGVDYLGVDNVCEALTLRKSGISARIMILGYTLPARLADVAASNSEMTVSSFDQLDEIKKRKFDKKIRIHLKIDTGMHRQGFQNDQIDGLIHELAKRQDIEVVGIYTHFADAKNPAFPANTDKQIDNFNQICQKFTDAGFKYIKHAASTAGALVYPKSHFDMVRIGIGLMGLWPSLGVASVCSDKMKLIPALTWKSIVSEIKVIKPGERLGYDLTENIYSETRIAIIPIGYWHGYRRALSSIGRVGINGKMARVLGRVSMDMIMVDVTNIPHVKVGNDVILIEGEEKLSAYEMARMLDGSWYEVITNLNPQIKRIYE